MSNPVNNRTRQTYKPEGSQAIGAKIRPPVVMKLKRLSLYSLIRTKETVAI